MTLTPFSRSQEGSDCWKMACLHPISRMKGCISTKLVHLYCCDWLDFGDLDPIFKVTQGLRLLKNGLSAPYLMKKWMDLTKLAQVYCCDMKTNWLDFGDHDPIFKVTGGLRFLENGFCCTLSPEWMDGLWPNLYSYIVETGTRTDLILVILTPFYICNFYFG